MPNVLLTAKCVRACPYCFAKKYLSDTASEGMSCRNVMYLLDFFELSGVKQVSYLGGEPLLHPDFLDFVLYSLERGFQVKVFTSGVVGEAALGCLARRLADIPHQRLGFLCNLNHPSLASEGEWEAANRFLDTFRRNAVLGYNMYQADFDIDFVFDVITQFGLRKVLRLGLAHPSPRHENVFVPVDGLAALGRRLVEYLPRFLEQGVRIGVDCGMPLCLFTDAELGALYRASQDGVLKFFCQPAIDIGPDMSVWACFPLFQWEKKSIYDFTSYQELDRHFQERYRAERSKVGGIMERCRDCAMADSGLCAGGWLAHLVGKG